MRRNTSRHQSDESGAIFVTVVFIVLMMGAVSSALFFSTSGSSRATVRNAQESNLLYVAESGLDFNAAKMASDPLYPVADPSFDLDEASGEYVGGPQVLALTDGERRTFQLRVRYLNGDAPVVFASRADPAEEWTRIQVSSTTAAAGLERQVVSWYRYEMGPQFGGAVISDSLPSGRTGLGGKDQAKNGDIVLGGKGRLGQHYIYGDLNANGAVRFYEDNSETAVLTEENASTYTGGFDGAIDQDLAGTADEIPDFTSVGSANQLFDFERFQAVATAGGGEVFTDLASFLTAMSEANARSEPLEGVIVLDIDSAAEGSNPKIESRDLPDGINIAGTLMFRFSEGTDANYKIFIKVPLNINAGDLTDWDPADVTSYDSGYPATLEDTPAPWEVDISPGYENFRQSSDLPALMFENGVVDIHGAANICGVIYGPSFIEIENKDGQVQYFNGSIIGGGGVFIEGNGSDGVQAIRFDSGAMDALETDGNKGKALVRSGTSMIH